MCSLRTSFLQKSKKKRTQLLNGLRLSSSHPFSLYNSFFLGNSIKELKRKETHVLFSKSAYYQSPVNSLVLTWRGTALLIDEKLGWQRVSSEWLTWGLAGKYPIPAVHPMHPIFMFHGWNAGLFGYERQLITAVGAGTLLISFSFLHVCGCWVLQLLCLLVISFDLLFFLIVTFIVLQFWILPLSFFLNFSSIQFLVMYCNSFKYLTLFSVWNKVVIDRELIEIL